MQRSSSLQIHNPPLSSIPVTAARCPTWRETTFLVDNERVSGVLEWANMMIGDPAMDLGFMVVAIADRQ